MPVKRVGQQYQRLNLALDALADTTTKVGWFESAKYGNGTPVAYVASIQELGWGPIPPRPFMRSTFGEKKENWAVTMGGAARAVLAGKETAKSAMDKLGLMVTGDIYRKISEITSPPLSPITIELRARKLRGDIITGKTVGEAAAAVAMPDYQTPTVSTKPLVEPGVFGGILLSTLTQLTESQP